MLSRAHQGRGSQRTRLSEWRSRASSPQPFSLLSLPHPSSILIGSLCLAQGLGVFQPVAVWSWPGLSPLLFPPLLGKGATAQGPHYILGATVTGRGVGPGGGLAGQPPPPSYPLLYKWDRCQEGREVFRVTQDQEPTSPAGRDIPQIKNREISKFL